MTRDALVGRWDTPGELFSRRLGGILAMSQSHLPQTLPSCHLFWVGDDRAFKRGIGTVVEAGRLDEVEVLDGGQGYEGSPYRRA
jgi:hypothetical protein